MPAGEYEVTIFIYRRPLGVGGAFSFYAEQQITLSADANTETNDYTECVEVPNEAGWETRAQACSAVRLP